MGYDSKRLILINSYSIAYLPFNYFWTTKVAYFIIITKNNSVFYLTFLLYLC